ncbi:hypothetical protein F442_08756, partial [Phytophthora nicotianae P10297]
MSFTGVWRTLTKQGWTSKKSVGLSDDAFYIRPGKSVKGVRGEDYFVGTQELFDYLDKLAAGGAEDSVHEDAGPGDPARTTANPPRTRSKRKKTTTATDEPRADGKERQPVAPPGTLSGKPVLYLAVLGASLYDTGDYAEHHSKQPGHPPRTRGKRKGTATAVDEPPPEHEDQQPDTPGGQPVQALEAMSPHDMSGPVDSNAQSSSSDGLFSSSSEIFLTVANVLCDTNTVDDAPSRRSLAAAFESVESTDQASADLHQSDEETKEDEVVDDMLDANIYRSGENPSEYVALESDVENDDGASLNGDEGDDESHMSDDDLPLWPDMPSFRMHPHLIEACGGQARIEDGSVREEFLRGLESMDSNGWSKPATHE